MPTLFFLTDDLHIKTERFVSPKSGNISLFVAGFHKYFDQIIICCPMQRNININNAIQWPQNLRFVSLAPYKRLVDYVRLLPIMLWKNLPALYYEIKNSDIIWLRLPAANGVFAYIITKLLNKKKIVVSLVGDANEVSKVNPLYFGWKKFLRIIGAYIDWKLTVMICKKSLVFAYGSHLKRKLEKDGCKNVHVSYTNLIKDEDVVGYDKILNNRQGNKRYFRILSISRLSAEKGLENLLRAVNWLGQKGYKIQLHIVGGGPEEIKLKNTAINLNNNNIFIKFWGYLNHGKRLDTLIDQADCFVLPSLSEGIPKVLLEVMSRGCAVIATNVGGIPDVIEHEKTGILVPPNDIAKLSNAIVELINKKDLRLRLALNGLKYARNHTYDKQILFMLNLIKENFEANS